MVNSFYDATLDAAISRLSRTGVNGSAIEGYDYLGLGTIVRRTHSGTGLPGVNLSYVKLSGASNGDAGDQYTGLDRFGRVVDQRWLVAATGANKDRYQYAYDRDSNRTTRTNLTKVDGTFNETYEYDFLNQLKSFGKTGTAKSWDYDAVGNWDGVTTNVVTQTRSHDKQNEIGSATGQTSPTYDADGNQTTDFAARTIVYDAWNRTRQVNPAGGGAALRVYAYDGTGRRIRQTTGATPTDSYYSLAWQVLEERVSGVARTQYVWSPM